MVFMRDLLDGAEDRYAGIVDPGVEAAELLDSPLGDPLHVLKAAHIRHHRDGSGAFCLTVSREILQGGLVPRDEDELCSAISQGTRGRQADAARCSGQNHHLLSDRLETHCHGTSSGGILSRVLVKALISVEVPPNPSAWQKLR